MFFLILVVFNISIGSVKTGFISISLSGVIVELATTIAVLFLTLVRVLSSIFRPTADFGTISLSSEVRIGGNAEDETDEIFDVVDVIVDMGLS